MSAFCYPITRVVLTYVMKILFGCEELYDMMDTETLPPYKKGTVLRVSW